MIGGGRMSTKNVYFYKLSLYDTQSHQEMSLTQTKAIIEQIIACLLYTSRNTG